MGLADPRGLKSAAWGLPFNRAVAVDTALIIAIHWVLRGRKRWQEPDCMATGESPAYNADVLRVRARGSKSLEDTTCRRH